MREKLTITGVKEIRKWKDTEIQDFQASNSKGMILDYSIFGKKELFPFIKPQAVIDAEFIEKPRIDKNNNEHIDRNIVQMYVDGKPVIEQKKGWGGPQGNTETQTAIKEIGECWRIGKFKDDDILVTDYRAWITGRLSPPQTPSSTPEKQATASVKAIPPSPALKQADELTVEKKAIVYKTDPASIKDKTAFQKACRDFGLNDPRELTRELNISSLQDISAWGEAYIKIARARG